MCCTGTKKTTKEFLNSANGRKGFYAWKVMNQFGRSTYTQTLYSPGVHHATTNSRKLKISRRYDKKNPSGIHVYLEEPMSWLTEYRVRVFCLFEDVILADDDQAVLMKIKIHKADWLKSGLK